MQERLEAMAGRLRAEIGDGLRGVFYGDFDTREYEIAYASPDALTDYSAGEIEEIVDDVALEQIGVDKQEALFEPIGELQVTVRVFEDGINAMAWGIESVPAVFVGLDGEVGNVEPVIGELRALDPASDSGDPDEDGRSTRSDT